MIEMIELSELVDAANKAFPVDHLRPGRDAGWQTMAGMGWLMMPIREEDGGLGLPRQAMVRIHYEMGRVLAPMPLATALASLAAIDAAPAWPERAGWIERLMAGEFVTLSLAGDALALAGGQLAGGRLTALVDADMASHVLIFAAADTIATDTIEIAALVPFGTPGLTLTERPLWDESRRLFDLAFDDVVIPPSLILARGDAARNLYESVQSDLRLALAADALGGAAAILTRTTAYLNARQQFGRPLAMFQALKHRCADLAAEIAAAEALLWAKAADPIPDHIGIGALKALACDVYDMVSEDAIQLHGGIGLTEEHECHLFMKRAQLNLWLAGSSAALHQAAGYAALLS